MKCLKRFKILALLVFITEPGFSQAPPQSAQLNCDSLRMNCYNFITGGNYSLKDPTVKEKINLINRNATGFWKNGFVGDTSNRTTLWNDLNYARSADMTTSYTRLHTMTVAYVSPGTELYQNEKLKNDIIYALDWLYQHKYNERVKLPRSGGDNNWWDYVIGSPDKLNNIVVMLYDKLGAERRQKYLKAISYSTPTVGKYTGANLLWVVRVIALNGINSGDISKVAYARDAVQNVFDYVVEGDGFYKDGSFIQHNKHSYTGGYGSALIGSLAELMYLFPSIQEIPASKHVYQWVYDSFEPLLFRSGMMSMTMGREVSRNNVTEHRRARSIVEALLLLSKIAPKADAERLKSIIKSCVLEDRISSNYYAPLSSITMISMLKAVVDDKKIPARGSYSCYRQFANMDRSVQQTPDYAFAISMHSSRIYNFESINDENLKGWHLSDGMTYLYDADQKQFDDNFWSTVNYQRLPGTTVEDGTTAIANKVSTKDWVGGASILDKYGVTGMDLNPNGTTLTAKKSWFMFDNEIVALGAGITNSDKKNVSTIIEQRKLNIDNTNDFIVDDEAMPTIFDTNSKNNVRWAYLSGQTPATGIGYYFPHGMNLKMERKVQSGRWSDVRATGPTTVQTRNYLSLWKDHGDHSEDHNSAENTYAYVLLPGVSQSKVKQYAKKSDVQILENTAVVQAVRDTKLGLTAANFWQDGSHSVSIVGGEPYLMCNKKASLLVMEEAGKVTISIADPTMKNEGLIEIEVHAAASTVISKDSQIVVKQLGPVIMLTVDVKNLKGKSVSASFSRN